MAKKKPSKVLLVVKDFLTPLKAPQNFLGIRLEKYSSQRKLDALINPPSTYVGRNSINIPIPSDDEAAKINHDRLEQARLDQEKDALNLQLKSQHKVIIATLITAMVALISALLALFIALYSKPPMVEVKPTIVNQSPKVEVNPNIILPPTQ